MSVKSFDKFAITLNKLWILKVDAGTLSLLTLMRQVVDQEDPYSQLATVRW